MHQCQHRRYGKAPLKSERNVDEDAGDSEKHCHEPFGAQLIANLGTDHINSPYFKFTRIFQQRSHLIADIFAYDFGAGLRPDDDLMIVAEERDIGTFECRVGFEDFPNLCNRRFCVIFNLDQRSPGKVDTVVEPFGKQQPPGEEDKYQRKQTKLAAGSHEIDRFFVVKHFHYFAPSVLIPNQRPSLSRVIPGKSI